MADETKPKKSILGHFFEEGSEVGGGILLGGLFEAGAKFFTNFLKKIAERGGEAFGDAAAKHPLLQDLDATRGKIFHAIKAAEQSGKKMDNLLRRIKEAQTNGGEYLIVHSLGKILSEKNEENQASIEYLNGLTDQEFKAMIDLLTDDPLPQAANQFRLALEKAKEEIQPAFENAAKWMDSNAEKLVESHKTLNDGWENSLKTRREEMEESLFYSIFSFRRRKKKSAPSSASTLQPGGLRQ